MTDSFSPRLARSACAVAFALGIILGKAPSFAAETLGTNAHPGTRFTLDRINQIVQLSSPQISPDGRSIVLVKRRAEADTNRWATELVLVDIATGSHRSLTPGRKEVSHPRWSPSGDRLAFLAPHGAGKEAQIFTLPMSGGEALQVTKSPTAVQHFSWRPDGKEIAFAAADEPPNKKAKEKGEDAFEVGDDDLFTSEAPMPVHIWLAPADGGEARRLTSGSWTLPVALPPSSPASPLSWSPDGQRIAFVRQETPHTGDADKCAVQTVEVGSGAIHPLTGQTLLESFPSYSPDGTQIVYWCNRDRDPLAVNDLFIASAGGGPGKNLTKPLDRNFFQSLWMPEGKSILTGAHDGTRVALWLMPLEGPARRLDLGDVNPSWSYWVDVTVGRDGSVAFVGSEPHRPSELYYATKPGSGFKRLTDFNHEIAGLELGRVEQLEWAGPDGFREDGILVYPPDYQPGRRLPLVLVIHGGPQSASTTVFSSLPQLLAARGYLVFSPNYRGSDNLGNAYQHAIFNDAGAGPDRDVMAGLDALKSRGIVDENRIAVSGWSYGGYMTSWMIGHHTLLGRQCPDALRISARRFSLDCGRRKTLPRTVAHHICNQCGHANAGALYYGRCARASHAVLPALSRAQRPGRRRIHGRLPGSRPFSLRPAPVPGRVPALGGLAGSASERWGDQLISWRKTDGVCASHHPVTPSATHVSTAAPSSPRLPLPKTHGSLLPPSSPPPRR
jgi:dipeptidyl aminopeptidase/acylaminoacyl peptidase